MVEIKSEENNTVQLPNNIRQVGTPGEKRRINKKSAEKLQTDWRAWCKKNIYRRLCDDVSESDDGREACSSKSSTSSW